MNTLLIFNIKTIYDFTVVLRVNMTSFAFLNEKMIKTPIFSSHPIERNPSNQSLQEQ